MERRIDFWRERQMLCGRCDHWWRVDLDWIDRWEQTEETCPGCGMTCEHEESPRVTVGPDDPALDDDRVAQFSWYHTSTQADWPTRDFDPAAVLTPETRRMMGGEQRVSAWVAHQRAKALQVGGYEAAVHNMLRRIRDQADQRSQFYLYRVRLKSSVVVREGWLVNPGNFVGDVLLDEVCPPGVDVVRYLNYHEDPGGLSLALGRDAIASVQRIAVPLPGTWDGGWGRDAVAALEDVSGTAVPATGKPARRMRPPSARAVLGRELGASLAGRLPVNLQDQFASAAAFVEGEDPGRWARRTRGLFDLIDDPTPVLAALDQQDPQEI
ncbi:hypothetical protein Sipo8835_03120 [Streptomyces ipomoeae]|uniref:Uncharacterized protein n=2 Tax=Streptomyces ipomoeae TaxID=103232 RepID=L1KJI2_9ACTN|nr:hypothetical protein [Streptomyces ipomoeae]EKX60742.1 hypothetical protein STRIP9103_00918 [Streptomyces ipomoeae 91-03]MDX2692033.1 hypothetical protein [Streptomyces ipomoeae]MDX2837616.1 hypothetical protein [Streptomyces ipomoeae]TQE39135.1 hypothetical protein Sipo8835_03120 [Streptomyces ipomoeae]